MTKKDLCPVCGKQMVLVGKTRRCVTNLAGRKDDHKPKNKWDQRPMVESHDAKVEHDKKAKRQKHFEEGTALVWKDCPVCAARRIRDRDRKRVYRLNKRTSA